MKQIRSQVKKYRKIRDRQIAKIEKAYQKKFKRLMKTKYLRSK